MSASSPDAGQPSVTGAWTGRSNPTHPMSQGRAVRRVGDLYLTLPAPLLPIADLISAEAPASEVCEALRQALAVPVVTVERCASLLNRIFRGAGVVFIDPHGPDQPVRMRPQPANAASRGLDRIRLRITLIPTVAVVRLARLLSFLFNRTLVASSLAVAVAIITSYLAMFGASALLPSDAASHPPGVAASSVGIGLILTSCLIHELGHAAASARHGSRPGRIGFGLYWMFPVFFSDVSASWQLGRKQRLTVDLGGIYFQGLAGASFAGLAMLTSDPTLRDALRLSVTVIGHTILSSANPALKFDGYWVYADLFNLPNLRSRANAALNSLACLRRPDVPLSLLLYALVSPIYAFALAVAMIRHADHAVGPAMRALRLLPAHLAAQLASSHPWSALSPVLDASGRLLPLVFGPYLALCCLSSFVSWLRGFHRRSRRSIGDPGVQRRLRGGGPAAGPDERGLAAAP